MATAPSASRTLPISAVERETGLAKDTLRIWERRYGFPKPSRDRNGDRQYTPEEVACLRNVKRLVDSGFRPGKVIADIASATDLSFARARGTESAQKPRVEHQVAHLLALVKRHARRELQTALTQQLGELGLKRFVLERIAPLTTMVGESWARGELSVHAEHLYSEYVNGVLRAALSNTRGADVPPCVLLTTFPGEPHAMGLLMAQCMFALESAETIALGVETPIEDIALASVAHAAEIVALSVSAAFNPAELARSLAVLRERLPVATQLWIGGLGAAKARPRMRGITTIGTLSEIAIAVAEWRTAASERRRLA